MQYDAQALIESLATAVLLTDSNLRIVYANSAAQQLFLLSRSKLLQLKLTDLLDKEQNLMHQDNRFMIEDLTQIKVIATVHKNDKELMPNCDLINLIYN